MSVDPDAMWLWMDLLPERERRMVSARYGHECEILTQGQLAAEFGLTRVRIGQIQNKAERKLRRWAGQAARA